MILRCLINSPRRLIEQSTPARGRAVVCVGLVHAQRYGLFLRGTAESCSITLSVANNERQGEPSR